MTASNLRPHWPAIQAHFERLRQPWAPSLLEFVESRLECARRQSRSSADSNRLRSERIRAAIHTESRVLPVGYSINSRAIIVRERIKARLDIYKLKRAPALKTIAAALRDMQKVGSLGSGTALPVSPALSNNCNYIIST